MRRRTAAALLALAACGRPDVTWTDDAPSGPRVAGPDGSPVPRALVLVRDATGGVVWMGLTGEDGTFAPGALPGAQAPFEVVAQVQGRSSGADPFAPSARLEGLDDAALAHASIALGPTSVPEPVGDLSGALVGAIGAALPEGVPVGAGWLGPEPVPIGVTCASAVELTLLRAAAPIALGWVTWAESDGGPEALDGGLAWADVAASGTGARLTLTTPDGAPRVFAPGERLALFVAPTGDLADPEALSTVPAWNPEARSQPERAPHVVALPFTDDAGAPLVVLGAELGSRDPVVGPAEPSDEDFDDVVLALRAATPGCLAELPGAAALDDPDGDGVVGPADAFPDDAGRAFVLRSPPLGRRSIAFEDTYPAHGDADYDDAVLRFSLEEVRAADGSLRDLAGTFHLVARGAGLDHVFWSAFGALPPGADGVVAVERRTSAGAQWVEALSLDEVLVEPSGARILRVPVFPSDKAALPPSNTDDPTPAAPPASARFVLRLAAPVDAAAFGAWRHDPALGVERDGELWDIHLPGRPGFPDRPAHLPEEAGDGAFLDDVGPWALTVEADFRYPLEKVPIDLAYPGFPSWLGAGASVDASWLAAPVDGLVVDAPVPSYHALAWSIGVAAP